MQRALRLLGGAGGLILAIWPAVVARADNSSPTQALTTITVAIAPGRSSTTVTIRLVGTPSGEPDQVQVTSDADPTRPAEVAIQTGADHLAHVPVDDAHRLLWIIHGQDVGSGCGPHPPPGIPGCERRLDSNAINSSQTVLAPPPGREPDSQQAATSAPTTPDRASGAAPQAAAELAPPQAPVEVPAHVPSVTTSSTSTSIPDAIAPAVVAYTVQPRDTLAQIAERFYGHPATFDRIAEANLGQVMVDGRMFANPELIQPGWVLNIPEPTRAVADQDGACWYTVQPADSLSGIAARLLGDQQRWPEVYELNRQVQPADGVAASLVQPSLIWPGMQLRLPPRQQPSVALSASSGNGSAALTMGEDGGQSCTG